MSMENVELVRAVKTAAAASSSMPEKNSTMFVCGSGCWHDWLEPWETYRTEIERVVDGGDRVLVLAAATPSGQQA